MNNKPISNKRFETVIFRDTNGAIFWECTSCTVFDDHIVVTDRRTGHEERVDVTFEDAGGLPVFYVVPKTEDDYNKLHARSGRRADI